MPDFPERAFQTSVLYKAPTSSAEPLSEIAEILAVGLTRVLARKSSQFSALTGESSLDFTPIKSGHPTPLGSEKIE